MNKKKSPNIILDNSERNYSSDAYATDRTSYEDETKTHPLVTLFSCEISCRDVSWKTAQKRIRIELELLIAVNRHGFGNNFFYPLWSGFTFDTPTRRVQRNINVVCKVRTGLIVTVRCFNTQTISRNPITIWSRPKREYARCSTRVGTYVRRNGVPKSR